MSDIKILVVDDEERMRKLVRDFLARKGYIVSLIPASRAPRNLPAHQPDTRQLSSATPARSSA